MIEEKLNVLITGGDGQLGQCLEMLRNDCSEVEFHFTNSKLLDITKKEVLDNFFKNNSYDYVINCAAYTNVEQVEKEPEKAFLVNAEGVKNLAEICVKYDITLIHISTDYVFDGKKGTPYTEEDLPNPINEYGKSKLLGEQYIRKVMSKYFIIRTSWLYSQFGKNFYRTILKKFVTEKKLAITISETGTPTNANELASFILNLISFKQKEYGIYHFSNQGEATWYDFAKEILRISSNIKTIRLKKTDNYPTFARRPEYSVLDKGKCIKTFNVDISNWENSLNYLYQSTE